jgi:hypothetical protein
MQTNVNARVRYDNFIALSTGPMSFDSRHAEVGFMLQAKVTEKTFLC